MAPADSPAIFALDAGTGQMLWQTELEDADATAGRGRRLADCRRQAALLDRAADQAADRLDHVWPDGPEKPGYGRGVLAAGSVLWPTREKIYVFDQQTAELKKAIDLAALGVRGGNLLLAKGRLLIVTGSEIDRAGTPG